MKQEILENHKIDFDYNETNKSNHNHHQPPSGKYELNTKYGHKKRGQSQWVKVQQYEDFFKHTIFWSNSMCMAATVVSFSLFVAIFPSLNSLLEWCVQFHVYKSTWRYRQWVQLWRCVMCLIFFYDNFPRCMPNMWIRSTSIRILFIFILLNFLNSALSTKSAHMFRYPMISWRWMETKQTLQFDVHFVFLSIHAFYDYSSFTETHLAHSSKCDNIVQSRHDRTMIIIIIKPLNSEFFRLFFVCSIAFVIVQIAGAAFIISKRQQKKMVICRNSYTRKVEWQP